MRCRVIAALALAGTCAFASRATAQTGRQGDSRFELGFGPVWIGHIGFDPRSGTETTPGGSRYGLFSTTSELGSATGIEARVGVRLSPLVEASAEASYLAPTLRTTVTSDVETASPSMAAVGVKQLMMGGSIAVQLPQLRFGGRAVPFVEAGAAYLRQVYDTLELAATGQTFHVGGGAAVPLAARRGHRPALGLRVHARAVARRKGIALDGRSHISPAAGASLILRF